MATSIIGGVTVSAKKSELKDVFGSVGYCIYSSDSVKVTSGGFTLPKSSSGKTVIEFPVAVDTLSISQDDPTINHYKVVGMNADWFATSQAGDVSISLTVPSKSDALLKVFFGDTAVTAVTAGKGTESTPSTWTGSAVSLEKHTLSGSLVLVNENQDQIMIINGIELWAKPMFENTSSEPFAFGLTGTITVDENTSDNFIWVKKS